LIIKDPAVAKLAPVRALLEVCDIHNREVMDTTTCEYGKGVKELHRRCPTVILATMFDSYDGEVLPRLESLDPGRERHLLQPGEVKMVCDSTGDIILQLVLKILHLSGVHELDSCAETVSLVSREDKFGPFETKFIKTESQGKTDKKGITERRMKHAKKGRTVGGVVKKTFEF
jgi:hypothetical protein